MLQFKEIQTGTSEYDQMIALRMEVLLNPIGIPQSYINEEKEASDILLGAFKDDELNGCCILSPAEKSSIQLRQMAVRINLQKKGIGKSIISYAETIALEKGYRTLFLHARNNVLSFYEKCGYTIEGDIFYEVGIPHYKMQKIIG
ncbi:MAG: GNAT family N-acetyltransferase [Candidatus Dadabacteria bacterium]